MLTKENVEHVASPGVDVIVTGSAVFDGVAQADSARHMLDVARGAGNQPALAAGADPEEG
jgi:pentose-5-phosphate-3-epimerase